MGKFKQRVDTLLVDRGLAQTPKLAQALVLAGKVFEGDRRIDKPGSQISIQTDLWIKSPNRYVGRGGLKLEYAVTAFNLGSGVTAIDIGASTGGFTDCLLQHHFQRVYAVDVGRGQLADRLVTDPRVIVMDKVNAKAPFYLPETVELIVVDVSFISVRKILASVSQHLAEDGNILALVKPQFEGRKDQIEKGGVIRDPKLHAQILGSFGLWAIEAKWRLKGIVRSPIKGHSGNSEFFVWLKPAPKVSWQSC